MAEQFIYMSDLHLELAPGFRVTNPNKVPYLLLAGDIGDPTSLEFYDFFEDCARQFLCVFYTLGNREAFGPRTWEQTVAVARAILSALPNVHLLHRSGFDVIPGKLRVVGTTLWTHIPAALEQEVTDRIPDYQVIHGMTVAKSNALHDEDVAFIDHEIMMATLMGVELVVLTHHAPLTEGTCQPRFKDSALTCAYACNESSLLGKPVRAWVHGHTHHAHEQLVHDFTILASNPRGYQDEWKRGLAFEPGKVLSLELGEDEQDKS